MLEVGGMDLSKMYTLTEVTPPKGYLKADDIVLCVTGPETIRKDGASGTPFPDNTIEVKSKKKPSVKFKYANGIGNFQIAGAKFELLDSAGNVITQDIQTSGTSVDLGVLDEGTYTLRQVEAPEGYQLAEDVIFTVDASGNAYQVSHGAVIGNTLKIYAIAKKTNVKIRKVDPDGNAVAGATLSVGYNYGGDGSNDGVPVPAYETDATGEKIVELDMDAPYVLKESKAPQGYLKAEEIKFNINTKGKLESENINAIDNSGEIPTLTMVDELETIEGFANIIINKVDESGEPLAGAKLKIVQGNTEGGTTAVEPWVTNSNGKYLVRLAEDSSFVLIEDEAPQGYEKSENIPFAVNSDGKLVCDIDGTVDNSGKTPILTITNKKSISEEVTQEDTNNISQDNENESQMNSALTTGESSNYHLLFALLVFSATFALLTFKLKEKKNNKV